MEMNAAGRIAKYFATSFAMLKVVSVPRVMRSCLPISTIWMSLVGFESRSTRLPASFAAWVPVCMATATSAWASAVAGHGNEPAAFLVVPDELEFRFRRCLGKEVIDACLGRDRCCGEGVVSGDHDGLDAHLAQFSES